MKRGYLKLLILVAAVILGMQFLSLDCEAAVKKQGDVIYMGSYPKTEMKGKKLTSKIKNASYNKSGYAVVNGIKYKRIKKSDARYIGKGSKFYQWKDSGYHYFKCEPIKWKIIGEENGMYILLADQIIDNQQYHNKLKSVNWANSYMRKWLNGEFYRTAFSASERKLLKKVSVTTPKNQQYGTSGGKTVKDRVYLLSAQETAKASYGFTSNNARKAKTTDYARAMGALTRSTGMGCWWPRTSGMNSKYAANILSTGKIYYKGYKVTVFDGVRPVIQINIKDV